MQRYMMNIFVYFDTLITWNMAFNNSCILSFTEFDFIKLDLVDYICIVVYLSYFDNFLFLFIGGGGGS